MTGSLFGIQGSQISKFRQLYIFTLVFSVSGYHNFEKPKAAGAAMTLADISRAGSIPMLIKAASTVPAIVANPPVITACNSDLD